MLCIMHFAFMQNTESNEDDDGVPRANCVGFWASDEQPRRRGWVLGWWRHQSHMSQEQNSTLSPKHFTVLRFVPNDLERQN